MRQFLFIFLLGMGLITKGQQTPLPANVILQDAYLQAAKEKKNVLVIFHASWCGWCHKMDASLNDVTIKKFFDDHYLIRHLVVFESKGKEQLENPGALELLKKYHAADMGIPFWLIFDANGQLLGDARMRIADAGLEASGGNIGCPATKKEVENFIKIIQRTSTLGHEALGLIEKRFRLNEQ